jgi:hypothetical protein
VPCLIRATHLTHPRFILAGNPPRNHIFLASSAVQPGSDEANSSKPAPSSLGAPRSAPSGVSVLMGGGGGSGGSASNANGNGGRGFGGGNVPEMGNMVRSGSSGQIRPMTRSPPNPTSGRAPSMLGGVNGRATNGGGYSLSPGPALGTYASLGSMGAINGFPPNSRSDSGGAGRNHLLVQSYGSSPQTNYGSPTPSNMSLSYGSPSHVQPQQLAHSNSSPSRVHQLNPHQLQNPQYQQLGAPGQQLGNGRGVGSMPGSGIGIALMGAHSQHASHQQLQSQEKQQQSRQAVDWNQDLRQHQHQQMQQHQQFHQHPQHQQHPHQQTNGGGSRGKGGGPGVDGSNGVLSLVELERHVVHQARSILMAAEGHSLKAVELANTLRSRLGNESLVHVRELCGGLLTLLEKHPSIFQVHRIPKSDTVSLVERGLGKEAASGASVGSASASGGADGASSGASGGGGGDGGGGSGSGLRAPPKVQESSPASGSRARGTSAAMPMMAPGQVGAPPPPPNGGLLSGSVQPLALSAPMPLGSPPPSSSPLTASDAPAVAAKPGHDMSELNDVVALLKRCKLSQYSEKLVEEEGYDDVDTLKTLKDEEFDDLMVPPRPPTLALTPVLPAPPPLRPRTRMLALSTT